MARKPGARPAPTAKPSAPENPEAPAAVRDLIDRFRRNRENYKSGRYNETQLRREFVDPFFKALGWDIDNEQGYAEAYKDVVHEDSLQIDGAAKAPDYSFRVGGARKFFVETKRPSVNLKEDVAAAFQLRRYAWSAKLPLSILTDFEEFAVYDCRVKPAKTDKASTARTLYLTFDQFIDRWPEIAGVFSRDAVYKGSFDRYADSGRRKRGTTEVDAVFLEEIEEWRDTLARNIALRNPDITQRDLNYAVQLTIDRIIFLRICEDRGIEDYRQLAELQKGDGLYKRLLGLFRKADQRYNSGLFYFEREKGRGEPDSLTPALTIDDKVLKDIIKRLYYPDSPYEFSVLPADILGQVYEQFLGKVIRLTKGHKAVVEEKPEVRKAGGVYYTPTYIVDYIVKNTVGTLLEGASVKWIGRRQNKAVDQPELDRTLRILDPACGSGSFLLGAYQHLLDWYHDWYLNNDPRAWARRKSPPLYEAGVDDWRLTIAERKRILLAHIFGVDIDPQAVEVTKLSLLLKVLEGESAQTMDHQLRLIHERALPDLTRNIKCGNSLIGPDFYKGKQLDMFSDEERYRINAFDWSREFSEILSDGGFDAVTGNPPYVYRNALTDDTREYFSSRYKSVEGNFDLYKFFIERGCELLTTGGRLGMIVSASFLVQTSFTQLRRLILANTTIDGLAPLGPRVFAGATVDTAILITSRGPAAPDHLIAIQAPAIPTELSSTEPYYARQTRFIENDRSAFDYRLTESGAALFARLTNVFPPIESKYEFGVGINTGFIRGELVAEEQIDNRYHPMVPGSGISRYGAVKTDGWIMYDPDYVRKRGKLGRTLPPRRFFDEPKILVVRTRNLSLSRRIIATIDRDACCNLNRLSNIISRDDYPLEGLLGILNSTLFNWIFSCRYYDYEIKPVYLRSCPLADSSSTELNALASRILDLHARILTSKSIHDRNILQRDIDHTDSEIDRLVYELYGLNEEEIALVEEHTRSTSRE